MLMSETQTAKAASPAILEAAEAAARAVPPAWPLEATVAVNPFLGQTGESLARTTARLARVGGVRVTPERAHFAAKVTNGEITRADLHAALAACAETGKPDSVEALERALAADSLAPEALPTISDLAAQATGADWPTIFTRQFGLWAAKYFDRGQALWTPSPGLPAFAAWREWATHDLTPELAGLTGFAAHVAASPDTPERAILRASKTLGLSAAAAETAFHRLLMDLSGWAQYARYMLWQAEMAGETDTTLTDLLAIRLVWEEALYLHAREAVAGPWEETVAGHAAPVAPSPDHVIDAILQDAAERAYQRRLAEVLPAPARTDRSRPALQAAFCIDVRSEVFRRALESVDPSIETIGFAGFFGLPVSHRGFASDLIEARLPVLLNPALTSQPDAAPAEETDARIVARMRRALGRFRQAAVSSFAFVEAAGPFYGAKLLKDALGLAAGGLAKEPAPRFEPGLSPEDKAATAAAVLKAMSLTRGHARLVLLAGHGANVTNNPQESAYHCGACGGYPGDVSARLLAALLNDAEARAGLGAHGIDLPEDTLFLAALHDTTTDGVALYEDAPAPQHREDITRARKWLAQAGALSRGERALRLPRGSATRIFMRAKDWAEVRPEWGLAGCAAFIAAPRGVSAGADLAGRAFLHSYDWRADEDFGTLELIMTAPVVVASWISLQYYGSTVAPEAFGSGNKLIHNVVGGIGVVQGNGGRLRAGLPWQAVNDGEALAHQPLRLSVLIEAPRDAMLDVLARHDDVRALFDNGWLHLFALEDGHMAARYLPGGSWAELSQAAARAAE